MVDLLKDKASDEVATASESGLMAAVQAMRKLTLEEKAQLLQYLSRALQYDIRQEEYKIYPGKNLST